MPDSHFFDDGETKTATNAEARRNATTSLTPICYDTSAAPLIVRQLVETGEWGQTAP